MYPVGVPAPVPRCSPFIIINKLAEFNSIMSDANPYFPLPPCEYGGPLEALRAGVRIYSCREKASKCRRKGVEVLFLFTVNVSIINNKN